MTVEISTDLANAVLEGDLANASRNVAQGDTLPAGKRKIFEDEVLARAQPETLHTMRRRSLLRKYAEGARLNEDELDEISDLIPDRPQDDAQPTHTRDLSDLSDDFPAPVEDPAPQSVARALQSEEPYALEVEAVIQDPPAPPPTLPTGYRFHYKHYEAVYQKKERTLLWWVAQGRAAKGGPDLPPLDAPDKMPEWWGRVMKQRCPDVVLSAATVATSTTRSAQAATSSAPALVALPSPGTSSSSGSSHPGNGFEDTLRDLRAQLGIAYRELQRLQAAPAQDPSAIEQARRRWIQLQEAAQKAEARAPDLLERQGKLIDRDTLANELAPMLAAVAQGIRSMRRRLQPKLARAVDDVEAESIWQNGTDELFEDLRRSGYAAPFALETLEAAA